MGFIVGAIYLVDFILAVSSCCIKAEEKRSEATQGSESCCSIFGFVMGLIKIVQLALAVASQYLILQYGLK